MTIGKTALAASVAMGIARPSSGFAANFAFEDLTTRNNLRPTELSDTYLGYEWG